MVKTNTSDAGVKRRRHDVDMLVVLCTLCLMPIYLYGLSALWLIFTAVVTAVAAEYVCLRIRGIKRFEKGDFSYLITALITALAAAGLSPAVDGGRCGCVWTVHSEASVRRPWS